MSTTYTLTEGNDALNRVLLMMRYDMGRTFNENVKTISEQTEPEELAQNKYQYLQSQADKQEKIDKKIDKEETDWLTKYIQLTTPLNSSNKSEAIIIPKDGKYKLWEESDNRQQIYFKTWLGSSKMSEIPDETLLKKILPNYTLRHFYTPDNLFWGARIRSESGKNGWFFLGFYNRKTNKMYDYTKYVTEPVPKSLTDDPTAWDYIVNYFETHDWVKELVWIIAAALAGALTGGIMSALIIETGLAAELSIMGLRVSTKILATYLGEAAVWSTKAGIEFSEGKNISGAIDLFFGFVLPIMHGSYLAKITGNGVTKNSVILLGNKLLGKSPEEIKSLLLKSAAEGGLSEAEKQLFKKIMTTPVEVWEKGVIETVEGASSKLVSEGKDPTQTLWKIMKENKIDIFSKMPWYKRIPLTLTNDFVFITLMAQTAKKFGLEDLPEEFLKPVIENREAAKRQGKVEEFDKYYIESLKSSKDLNEVKNKVLLKFKNTQSAEVTTKKIESDPKYSEPTKEDYEEFDKVFGVN